MSEKLKANVRFVFNFGALCHNTSLKVSITKFSIVISSPRTCHVFGVQTFSNWKLRDSFASYAHLNGFHCNVSNSFQTYESATGVFDQKKLSKEVYNSELCYRYD